MKPTLSRMALLTLLLGLVVAMADSALGRPILPAERRFSPFTGLTPACDDPHVLGLITQPFREKEYDFWHTDLQITGYDQIVQTAYRADGRDHIPRRYCTARAFLNDASRHEVVYWVGENTGYAGYDYGVQWCIIGLDRNLAYGPLVPGGAAVKAPCRAAAFLAALAACGLQVRAQDAPRVQPSAFQPRGAGGGSGDFDFYLLSLSWSPSFCAGSGAERAREQCAAGAKNGFVVHGLWPNYDRGRSPQNCGSASPTRRQIDEIHGLYPDDGLARHEWRTHGTCSGKSPTEYFADVKAARQAITVPAAFTAPTSDQTLATSDIARAFIDANKGLRLNAMAVTCRAGSLEEVRICFSKDLRRFVTCEGVSRAGCRARQVSVPAVR